MAYPFPARNDLEAVMEFTDWTTWGTFDVDDEDAEYMYEEY